MRESDGQGGAVLLCHGNSLGAETFDRLLGSPLGEKHRLIAFDLPGHGRSPDDPDRYGLGALVDAAAEVATGMRLGRPVLVGHSLGGHVMASVAARLGSARGLFVFGTPLLSSLADLRRAFVPHRAVDLLFQSALSDDDIESLTALLAPRGGADGALVERLLRRTDPPFRERVAASLATEHQDELAPLRELGLPVAIVHGAEDPLVDLEYLEGLELQNLWRGEVKVIAGAGHVPQLDAPEELAALLRAFIDDVS